MSFSRKREFRDILKNSIKSIKIVLNPCFHRDKLDPSLRWDDGRGIRSLPPQGQAGFLPVQVQILARNQNKERFLSI
jgi:hypothetical protein